MRANVSSEQPRPGEGLPAGGTHAGQGVRADVHLQGPQAGVLLGAVFAVEAWASGALGGRPQRRDGRVVGRLVMGERGDAAAARAAVEAVVEVLHRRGTWGV